MTDQKNFSEWVGRKDTPQTDILTPRLERSFEATLGPHLADVTQARLGLHWCLAPPIVPTDQLGQDGHPKKGGFLPPIPLPRRMWAGGEVHFLAPMQAGATVTRSSQILSVTSKAGKSGPLWFVAVENLYATDGSVVTKDIQNIVYREAATALPPLPVPEPIPDTYDAMRGVDISSVELFRYSALTFNGHRFHYDLAYAQNTEFYRGLVIHGPLQATLLLNFAASLMEAPPRRFSYKGLAPATAPQELRLAATCHDERMELSVYGADGTKTMGGEALW